MATQWGIECWCANEVEVKYERHGEGAVCNYACAGDKVRYGFDFGTFMLLQYYIGSPTDVACFSSSGWRLFCKYYVCKQEPYFAWRSIIGRLS